MSKVEFRIVYRGGPVGFAVWKLMQGTMSATEAEQLVSALVPLLNVHGVDNAFWTVWGGVAGLWVVGRTRERVGAEPGAILGSIYGRRTNGNGAAG